MHTIFAPCLLQKCSEVYSGLLTRSFLDSLLEPIQDFDRQFEWAE